MTDVVVRIACADQVARSGVLYTEEALRNLAERNPKRYTYCERSKSLYCVVNGVLPDALPTLFSVGVI